MVDTIIASFMNNLHNVTWMDDATKQLAIQKENLLVHRVGYPAEPNQYINYTVSAGQHLQTVLGFQQLAFQQGTIAQLGKASNRKSWSMFGDTVNAYYDDPTNSLSIPAGIMQPPCTR